jgi:hypothetical protein
MKRITTLSTLTIILSSLLLLVSCGSKTVTTGQLVEPEPTPTNKLKVPEWFTNVPEDPNYLYSSATAESRDLQHAVNTAKEEGRADIARQMRTKISGLFKRFREETGVGEDAEFLAMETDVSKSVVSETLVGCKTKYQDVLKEGTGYRAYVLMELPIGVANEALLAKIKENQQMYTRFRASQAFNELEEEVEKYEQFKKEQGME